jgi:uncharacterized OB-fold protein
MTDEEVFAHFHDVKIDRDNIAHYRGLLAGKLLLNRCDECGHWIYPHRPLCPECFSWKLTLTEVSGKGRLYMWTLIHQSRDPNEPLTAPIVTAAIELVEQKGLRYLSRIVDCPVEVLAHDMPVMLTWVEERGRQWPAFAPESAR